MDEGGRGADVRLAVNGDADALQRLIVYYHGKLRGVVAAQTDPALRQRLDPDDVLQHAYIIAFRAIRTCDFEGAGPFYKWLETIALSRLRDHERTLRRQKRDVGRELTISASFPDLMRRLATESTPSRCLAREELVAAMTSCLARLSDDQRAVVRLRYLEGKSVAEVAAELQRTESAVHMLCHRGLKALRLHIETLMQGLR